MFLILVEVNIFWLLYIGVFLVYLFKLVKELVISFLWVFFLGYGCGVSNRLYFKGVGKLLIIGVRV